MSRKPCQAEDWFTEDALYAMEGLCAQCRDAFEAEISIFDSGGAEQALRAIYRQSRSIRVMNAQSGKPYRQDNWDALHYIRTIRHLILMSENVTMGLKPHLG